MKAKHCNLLSAPALTGSVLVNQDSDDFSLVGGGGVQTTLEPKCFHLRTKYANTNEDNLQFSLFLL